MSEIVSLFEADSKIEKATQKLFQLDQILKEICEQIKSSLKFDFSAISLVNKERNIIEAVQGTQEVRWINLAKHYLELEPTLRDIQADIYYTQNIEVISGNDPRFDDCIYESCNHKDVVRIFLPIIVIESDNDQDRIIRDWFNYINLIDHPLETPKPLNAGQHQRYRLQMSDDFCRNAQVIGTVEAGYFDPERNISRDQVRQLTKFIADHSLLIWEARLVDILKVIVTEAKVLTGADSATLHYLYKPNQINSNNSPYVYEELAGFLRRDYLSKCPPRPDGLGQEASNTNEPQWISQSEELHRRNPIAYDEGLRAMAAFPFIVGNEKGVLYTSRTQIHEFNEIEIQRGQFLARRAVEAIRYALIRRQAQYRDKQLTTLHEIAQSLLDVKQEGTLLRLIAGNTRNILAADVVTIYEFIESENRFLTPPDIAGKLRTQESTSGEGHRLGVPLWLIDQEQNLYASVLIEHEIFRDSHFDKQENICSVAGVKLIAGSEVVGVMFINYRRPNEFSPEEQQFIETLASHAAIAIKNRRSRDQWLENLVKIDRQIITALEQTENALLKLVVERAVQLTSSDLGEIWIPNLISQELNVKSSYPSDIMRTITPLQPGEGIAELAVDRQSRLNNDIRSYPQEIVSQNNIGSRLSVPLLDQNDQLLGILNVESYKRGAFTQSHQRSLEGLANRAVIGIDRLKIQEKVSNMEAVVLFGLFRAQIVHKIKNDVGSIRNWSEDIRNWSENILKEVEKIALRVEKIVEDFGFLEESCNLLTNDIDSIQNWSKDTLREANRITFRADKIVEDLRSIRFLEEPTNPENPNDNQELESCNLCEIVRYTLERIGLPQSIDQHIDVPEDLPIVCAKKQQLVDILDNLVRNSLEAMQSNGGCLSIHGTVLDSPLGFRVRMEVCDTGSGIELENLNKIYRIGFSTKKRGGFGFGLSMVKYHVASLGGIMNVESQIGQGTRFTVILPAQR